MIYLANSMQLATVLKRFEENRSHAHLSQNALGSHRFSWTGDFMKYKALFLDIDGTLLNSEGVLLQNVLDQIERIRKMGVHVVPASGRADAGMVKIAQALNMHNNGGYLLSYNGGKVIDVLTREVVFEKIMSKKLATDAFAFAQELGLAPLTYNETHILALEGNDEFIEKEVKITSMPVTTFDGDFDKLTTPIYKCLAVGSPDKINNAQEAFKNKFGDEVSVYTSCPVFLEIMPHGITKAEGAAQLLKHLNIKQSECVACGDGYNDVDIITYAGKGFAMGNAPQDIKDLADAVLPTNDEGGVGAAIEMCWPV